MTFVIKDIDPKEDLKSFVPYKDIIVNFFDKHLKNRRVIYDSNQSPAVTLDYKSTEQTADKFFNSHIVDDPDAAIVKAFIIKMMTSANCIKGYMVYNPTEKAWFITGSREYIEDMPIEYTLNMPKEVWYDELQVQVVMKSKTGSYISIQPIIKNSFRHPLLTKAITDAANEAAVYFKNSFKNKKGKLVKNNRWRPLTFRLRGGAVPEIKVMAQLAHSLGHNVEVKAGDF